MDPMMRRTRFERVLAMIVASLMLLNVTIGAGPALADMGVICASPQSGAPSQTQPAVPESGQDHALCCVIHCAAAGGLPPSARLSLTAPTVQPATLAAATAAMAPAPRLEPKGAPQSPRAPPVATLALSA